MDKKTFSTLHTRMLGIDKLFGLIDSTANMGTSAQSLMDSLGTAVLARLVACRDELATAIKKVANSILTGQVNVADKDRDSRMTEVKNTINLHMKGRDASKKNAAESLKNFLSGYWHVESEPLDVETTLIADFMSKYNASETYKTQAALIGIDGYLTELEASNNNLNALYQKRNSEVAANVGDSASGLKPDLVWVYDQFCNIVEMSANFTPSDTFTTLFNEMETLRKKYRVLVPTSSGSDDSTLTDSTTTGTK